MKSIRGMRIFLCAFLALSVVSAVQIDESLELKSLSLPNELEIKRNQMEMLVMVGKVTSTTARVVYEPLVNDEAAITVTLVHEDAVVKERRHPQHQAFPYALAFDDLVPGNLYYVTFRLGEEVKAVARFRTPALDISKDKLTLLTLSCDRFLQDHDDSHWKTIVQEVRDPSYYGAVHTGDQIYADDIVSTFRDATYESALRAFRGLYRKSFGRPLVQRVLRQGAHYMLIDDHEIINNWNRETFITDKNFARAGLQAYYEYQYQLQGDLEGLPFSFQGASTRDLYRPIYHSVHLGTNQLNLVLIDTRMERGLTLSSKQLMSDKQLKFLREELHQNNATESIVFSALPLYFHSRSSAAIAEFVDDEMYPGHESFEAVLERVWSILPATSVRLVAGDLHMANEATICDASQSKCIPQLISSGMTKRAASMAQRQILLFHYLVTQWFQKANCLYTLLTNTGVCVHSEQTFYGQNYAKLVWDHGVVTSTVVTKPYEEPVDQLLQAITTYCLDFRLITTLWVLVILRFVL